MTYTEVQIAPITDTDSEIIVALLSQEAYDTFINEPQTLKAYIPSELFDKAFLEQCIQGFDTQYTTQEIAQQNWNQQWESSYQPVIVNSKVAIRATFHPEIEGVEKNIIITPKMSFGTGHHATTKMMMTYLSEIQCTNKTVFDYGCGTGVLGIYASYLGASQVVANDIDTWCVENTQENMALNHIHNMQVLLGGIDIIPVQKFDIILANINLHILQNSMYQLSQMLAPDGILLLSGILQSDNENLIELCEKHMLKIKKYKTIDNWSALYMAKM